MEKNKAVRRANGAILIDGRHVADTVQCCHCNMHYQMITGSGIKRGFCLKCMKPTCGRKFCDPCVPFEMKMDLAEKGKIKFLF